METTDWQNLSKKERRRLKKDQKRFKKKQEAGRRRLMKWGFLLGVVVLLGGGFFLFKNIKARQYRNAPKIQIAPISYDFGEIQASKGKAKTTFEVKNVGVSALKITGMETSCGCTTARLKIDNKESPEFGMHNNPTGWSVSVEPREAAELIVIFDPNFHQDSFGPVTRIVSIFSNDPWKSEEKVTIQANVRP